MARYVSGERIKLAVDRLRQSRASGGMLNFLILKRALSLSANKAVGLSTKDDNFQQAITELALWPSEGAEPEVRPFVDVFGSQKVKNWMKKQKYRSNGPADTLKNGTWSSVVKVDEGDRSKTASLQRGYRSGLGVLTILKDKQRPMPRLKDAAIWYYRCADITDIIGDATEPDEIGARLSSAFCDEIGLFEEDVAILFD